MCLSTALEACAVCVDSPVLLPSTSTPCDSPAHVTTVLARPPAAAPAGGCVACRVPASGLPPSSPMPRGPPPRAPPFFPECMVPDGNRMGADSCAPVGPAAASGPGFHVRWPPSGPRVSARAIPVTAGGLGLPADARVSPLSMNFYHLIDGHDEKKVSSFIRKKQRFFHTQKGMK